ncbi:cysteine proteinase [Biscogniauxia marginata]|nr:cysteine proteinase [Biscogniauxia marginata]
MDTPQENGTEPPDQQDTLQNGTRRSGRAKKLPSRFDDDTITPNPAPSPQLPAATQTRPKRKAAVVASENIIAEGINQELEQFLARVSPDERKEYRGWVELESEPAFFNAMLRELGANDFKVQEVFGMDEFTLDELPKPVHGLIFLYQYTDADESSESRQDCPDNLWFGNQTTANACATVALMNIIMNAKDVKFGAELQEFKESTKSLPPPHRGHALDTNDFIRAIHNSVARRSDLVSEDLLLDNKFEAAEKKRKMGLLKKKPQNLRAASRKKADIDTSYHYIAYVPVDGQVWELDGFEAKPLCLGPHPDASWLGLASQAIQTRMMRDDSEFLSFNLLAICQSPLTTLSRRLATSLLCSHVLDALYAGSPSWTVTPPFKAFPPDRLSKLDLKRESVLFDLPSLPPNPTKFTTNNNDNDNVNDGNSDSYSDIARERGRGREPPADFTAWISAPDFDLVAARRLAADLRAEQESLEAQFAAEAAGSDESLDMVRGRQRDYTPAVHEWVRILAEKGVLRELIMEADRES